MRRRGENIHPQNQVMYLMRKMWGDKEFLSFINEKIEWSRHLVFWSLGTLTGLRDRVRGLVA